jgi:hypothetical protein
VSGDPLAAKDERRLVERVEWAMQLFDATRRLHGLGDEERSSCLEYAACCTA